MSDVTAALLASALVLAFALMLWWRLNAPPAGYPPPRTRRKPRR